MTLRDTEVVKVESRSDNSESRKRQQQQQQATRQRNKQKLMPCIFQLPTKTGAWQGVIILNKLNWTRSLLTECLCGYVAKKRKTVNGKRNMNNVLLLQRMQQTSYPSPWPAFQACYCKKRKALQLNYPRVSYHPETKHSNQKSKVGFEKTFDYVNALFAHKPFQLILPNRKNTGVSCLFSER